MAIALPGGAQGKYQGGGLFLGSTSHVLTAPRSEEILYSHCTQRKNKEERECVEPRCS